MWFPGIDKVVKEAVHNYIPCQASNPKHTHCEPICSMPLPAVSWTEISGVCRSLPIWRVSASHYWWLQPISWGWNTPSLSANVVIPYLNMVFARQGYPTIIKTDNGPPFQRQDFKDFATQSGFRRGRITTLWPEANGEAKHFVHTLKRYNLTTTV